ncbi:hypothetical protein [Deinococcus cellulosilyticus]|uniref:hypothetical protein n=1 Tax=Deinococcus cellulosilyticus TaxID=401558 RepID=UPI0011BF7EC2|nr:hypothetical protein [Deinococcus cellulosilyticus]
MLSSRNQDQKSRAFPEGALGYGWGSSDLDFVLWVTHGDQLQLQQFHLELGLRQNSGFIHAKEMHITASSISQAISDHFRSVPYHERRSASSLASGTPDGGWGGFFS